MAIKLLCSRSSKAKVFKFLLPLVCSFFLIITYLLSTFAADALKEKKEVEITPLSPTVIIDAGHGGFDGGAIVGDIFEKDINLAIANALSDMLKLSGIKVINTRTDDTSTESDASLSIANRKKSDLRNRLYLANSHPEAILISIHQNKFSSPSAKGAQVFYGNKSDKSPLIAESIRKNIVSLTQSENKRALKKATKDVFLLYNSEIPAVIVECGFMSNESELIKLLDKDYQNKIAFAIFCGILEYIN